METEKKETMGEMDTDIHIMPHNLGSMVSHADSSINARHERRACNRTQSWGNADTVHVSFTRPPSQCSSHPPGYIMVTLDKHQHDCITPNAHSKQKEEFVHDLGETGNILISSCGGDGGRGANGENGQGGGHGRRGTIAKQANEWN